VEQFSVVVREPRQQLPSQSKMVESSCCKAFCSWSSSTCFPSTVFAFLCSTSVCSYNNIKQLFVKRNMFIFSACSVVIGRFLELTGKKNESSQQNDVCYLS